MRTHEESLSWEAHETSITCLAAAEKLNLLCSGAEDGTICLWEVPTGWPSCLAAVPCPLCGGCGVRATRFESAICRL